MSIVYSALQNPIDRTVAIKMLKREYTDEPLTIKRFYLEATAVSKLKHQNILTIHDVGETDDGVPYFVMEFLDGVSLSQLIDKYGAIHYLRALPIFSQICNAMGHAHRQGLIHRDLKPSNIMLTEEDGKRDFVKLVDFGIVMMTGKKSQRKSQRLTQKGEIWGSPFYMSPEQCTGGEIDTRSDIYSMGMVMYEILVGRPAFEEKNIGRIVNKHLKEMPLRFVETAPGKGIPETIEEVVFRCIQKSPDKRYQTMEELELALQALIPRRNISYHGLTPPAGIDVGNNAQAAPPPRPAQRSSQSASQSGVQNPAPRPQRETTTEIPPISAQSGKFSNAASNSSFESVTNSQSNMSAPPPLPQSNRSLSDTAAGVGRGPGGSHPQGRESVSHFGNAALESEDNGVEEVIPRKKSFDEVKNTLASNQPEKKSSTGIYMLIGGAILVVLLFIGGIAFAVTRIGPVFDALKPIMGGAAVPGVIPSQGTSDTSDTSGTEPGRNENVVPKTGGETFEQGNMRVDGENNTAGKSTDSQNNDASTNTTSSGGEPVNSGSNNEQSTPSESNNSSGTTAGVSLSGVPVIIPNKNTSGSASLIPSRNDNQATQNVSPSSLPDNQASSQEAVQPKRNAPVGQRAQIRSIAPNRPRRNAVSDSDNSVSERNNSLRINRKHMSGPSDDDQLEQMYLRKKRHRGDANQQWQDYSDAEGTD